MADKYNLPLLQQIPIVQSIREDGDKGTPSALDQDSIIGQTFYQLAKNTVAEVKRRNAELEPTSRVKIDSATTFKTYNPNNK